MMWIRFTAQKNGDVKCSSLRKLEHKSVSEVCLDHLAPGGLQLTIEYSSDESFEEQVKRLNAYRDLCIKGCSTVREGKEINSFTALAKKASNEEINALFDKVIEILKKPEEFSDFRS